MFTPAELIELRARAEVAVMSGNLGSSSVSTAYMRLYEALDSLHAITIREVLPDELLDSLHGVQEGSEESEGTEPPPESEEPAEALTEGPRDKEQSALDRPVFRVRPKGAKKRLCSVCGEPQWTSPGSGWTCSNGHGGAPPKR